MPLIPAVRSLWRNVVHRRRVEQELDDELRAVSDILEAEKVRSGMSEADARRAARLELGHPDTVKAWVRDGRAGAFLDGLAQDVRGGARTLGRQPLFTATATLSLAVCIGANTAIFTLVNKLLFATPRGVAEPHRLVDIAPTADGRLREPFLHPVLVSELRSRASLVEVFGHALEVQPLSLRGRDGAERVFGGFVTANYFDVLGVTPAAGRLFGRQDDDHPGNSSVAVLSHAYWVQRFDGDPGVVGRPLQISGHPFTIAGIAAREFRGLSFFSQPDLWLPSSTAPVLRSGGFVPLAAGGRLRPGASIAQAAAEIDAITAAVQRDLPRVTRLPPGTREIRSTGVRTVAASPLPPVIRGLAAGVLALLTTLVGLVLAIACANLAAVLLARGAARRREISVRLALGAGRGRVVRQMLTETLLLFLLGGAAGLALARVMTSLLALALPALPVPVDVSLPLDSRALLFTGGLSLVAAVMSGLLPAMRSSKADVLPGLKREVQGPSDRGRMQGLFVVGQVAVSIALVVAAGLFIEALQRTGKADPGFDPEGVEATSLDLSLAGYTEDTGPAFVRTLVERTRALPRVTDVSVAIPAGAQVRFCCGIVVPGVEPPDGQEFFQPAWNVVEPGYFRTLRTPIVSGRDFSDSDRRRSEPVAIVSESAARQYWPGRDAIGKHILWQQTPGRDGAPGAPLLVGPDRPIRRDPIRLSVVGVARDVRAGGREAAATIYLLFAQKYQPNVSLITRTGDGPPLASELRALVASLDPNLPVLGTVAVADQISPVTFQLRLAAGVSAAVGLIGVLLAAVGVYGVTAYAVTMRTREIGVRLAMGAQRRDIVSMVLRRGMALVWGGSLAGLGLAAVAARLLAHNRFGIPAMEPFTFAAAAVLFCGVGLIACCVPVWRATRVNPVEALRFE